MKKTGFTLIELLAVIVILAIIALIATPIVINIINDSKKESINRSIELYIDHVQKMVAKEQMKDPTFNPSKCKINEGNLTCDGKIIQIEMKGQMPKSGTIKFSKGMVIEGVNLELDNLYYQVKDDNISKGTKEKVISYRDYITKVSDADNDGKVSPGDKYTYEVMDNMENPYTFYVLSVEGDKVNLIMDRNICKDGTTDYANDQDNNFCRYAWESNNVNGNGPITALTALGNGTRNWTNVPNINLEYDDITDQTNSGYTGSTTYGYKGITIINGEGYITKKDGTTQTPITLTDNMSIKARLPKLKEITDAGCHIYKVKTADYGTCPVWLMENITYFNVSSYSGSGNIDKYSMNNNTEAYQNQIYGYWLLSSYPGSATNTRGVNYYGFLLNNHAADNDNYGVRPVITVLLSDLS